MADTILKGKPDARCPHVASSLYLISMLGAFGLAAAAFGAHSVSTVDELVTAIQAVNNGDSDTIISVAPGYYDVSGCAMNTKGCLSITRKMTIQGSDTTSWRTTEDRNAKVVLDAKYAASVIIIPGGNVSGIQLQHLTIQNGTNTNASLSDGAGAGIQNGWYGRSYVSCSNCVFRNNMTNPDSQGGAGHMMSVYDCYFTNNVAKEGGALLATLNTQDCLFEDNRASANGGALRNGAGIVRCTFIGNTGGYGSCNYAATYTVSDCVCISNRAGERGCFATEGITKELNVKNSRFYYNRNTLNSLGGACCNPYLVTNCVFVGNSVPAKGGGAVATATNITLIVDCVFTNNVCESLQDGGGAVAGWTADTNTWPMVINCVFHENMATNTGGAVWHAVVSNCAFSANVATFGSAVSEATVFDSTFDGDHAVALTQTGPGGAVHSSTVYSSVFRGCVGSYGGGAHSSTLSNCTFIACHAEANGGAAYNSTLTDCLITNCTCATALGAGGVSTEADCTARRVTFVDCHCSTNDSLSYAAGSPSGAHNRLEDCTFIRCHPSGVLSAVRCDILGNGIFQSGSPVSGNANSVIGSGVFTNCLVHGVCAPYVFNRATLVNCTIVSNNWGCSGQIFANDTRAWNCVFLDNYHNKNVNYDLAGYGQWYFTNCVYKTHPGWTAYTFHDGNCIKMNDKTKLFLQPGHPDYDAAHPYKPGLGSPLRDAGSSVPVWPADAVDLAGKPRFCNHYGAKPIIDIGCYECWIFPRGTVIRLL